jgi:hypothetical protein
MQGGTSHLLQNLLDISVLNLFARLYALSVGLLRYRRHLEASV